MSEHALIFKMAHDRAHSNLFYFLVDLSRNAPQRDCHCDIVEITFSMSIYSASGSMSRLSLTIVCST